MSIYNLTFRHKVIIFISILLLSVSIGLQVRDYMESLEPYTVSYEYINIKDMTQPHVATKVSHETTVDSLLNKVEQNLGTIEEVAMKNPLEPTPLPVASNSAATVPNKKIWYLPTQYGQITQYPNYGHVAYDLTSWRGTGETIYPIANGTISGIYTDSAGALIVTVLHNVNGVKYTSQYVHLSSYASGIYIGKPVTINDALGQMGTTGYSTGVHLHIAVLDCALFDSNDPNCYDLNAWHRYGQKRLAENFYGLGVLVYVPDSWSSR